MKQQRHIQTTRALLSRFRYWEERTMLPLQVWDANSKSVICIPM